MNKAVAYRTLVTSCVTALLAVHSAPAADLHLIFMADTLDPGIGTQVDLQRAGSWGQTIAGHTGLTLRLRTLSGQLFTASRARSMLETLSPAEDDVVYFAYSGHGANLGDSPWPTFVLMTGGNLDFQEVLNILQPKPQRLLIALADCCNALPASGRWSPELPDAGQSALTTANFQRLFLEFRGSVLASSSAAGQYSLGDASEGGLFLNTFRQDLVSLAGTSPQLTWQTVLATTAQHVKQSASRYGTLQVPQFVIASEQVAAGTPADGEDPPDGPTDTTTDPAGSASVGPPLCGSVASLPMTLGVCAWMLLGRRRRRIT